MVWICQSFLAAFACGLVSLSLVRNANAQDAPPPLQGEPSPEPSDAGPVQPSPLPPDQRSAQPVESPEPPAAQETDQGKAPEPNQRPVEVIITGARLDTQADDSTATVSIISGRQAAARPITNADDLLLTQPSYHIQRYQGIGNAYPQVVMMRGIVGADRTLFLLDGQPVNEAITGYANLNVLPTARIRRIETVRGPFSALYGSRAVGGVVQVLTKPGGDHPGAMAQGGVGTFGTMDLVGTIAAESGIAEVSLIYNRREQDNYLGNRDEHNLDYRHHRLHARVDLFRRSRVSLMATGGLLTSTSGFNQYVDTRYSPAMNFYLRNEGRNQKDNSYGQLVLKAAPWEQIRFQSSIGVFHQHHSYYSVPVVLSGSLPGTMPNNEVKAWSNELRFDNFVRLQISDPLAFTLGVDQVWDLGMWRQNSRDTGLRVIGYNARISNTAGYAQAELSQFDRRLIIQAGARVDRHSTSGAAVSPRLGINAKVTTNTILRASAGRGFRAPSIAQLYSQPWIMVPPYPIVGNESLRPESVWAADLGVEEKIGDAVSVRLTGFFNDGRNLIALHVVRDPSDPNYNKQQYYNISAVQNVGGEFEFNAVPNENLSIRASYSYVHSENLDTHATQNYVPAHTAGLSLIPETELAGLQVGGAFDLRVVGPREYQPADSNAPRMRFSSYALGNLRAFVRRQAATFFVDVFNLWDSRFWLSEGITGPRLLALAGMRIETDWNGNAPRNR